MSKEEFRRRFPRLNRETRRQGSSMRGHQQPQQQHQQQQVMNEREIKLMKFAKQANDNSHNRHNRPKNAALYLYQPEDGRLPARVLVTQMKKGKDAGHWTIPGGKIDEIKPNDDSRGPRTRHGYEYSAMAAMRECREETGMGPTDIMNLEFVERRDGAAKYKCKLGRYDLQNMHDLWKGRKDKGEMKDFAFASIDKGEVRIKNKEGRNKTCLGKNIRDVKWRFRTVKDRIQDFLENHAT